MESVFLAEHPPIPGYEPVRPLGRNGLIVYLARQVSNGEEVVLKVACDPWCANRLRTCDAQVLHLDHPHILRVFAVGEVEGCAYSAVEHVHGTLDDELRNGPLLATEAPTVAHALALALLYARGHGMVQLNLAPGSIALTGDGVPKLTDLQPVDIVERCDPLRRVAHPAFAAPEDLTGGNGLAAAADVYRVGAALYAMLTGEAPFTGTLLEIVTAVAERRPVPPRELNPAVSEDVEAVCLKCLSKEPECRYGSLQDLADALLAAGTPRPAGAARGWMTAAMPTFFRRAWSVFNQRRRRVGDRLR